MQGKTVKNGSKSHTKSHTQIKLHDIGHRRGRLGYISIDQNLDVGCLAKTFEEHRRAHKPCYVVSKLGWGIYKIKCACSELAACFAFL